MNQKKFSDEIKEAVHASGLSRYAIAKAIGISQSTMSRFMNGKGGLSMDYIDRLGGLLGLHVVSNEERRTVEKWHRSGRKAGSGITATPTKAEKSGEKKGHWDLVTTKAMAAVKEVEVNKIRDGYVDAKTLGYAANEGRPLSEHLNGWEESLRLKRGYIQARRVVHHAGTPCRCPD